MPSSRSSGTGRPSAPVAIRRWFRTPLRITLFIGLVFFAISWLQKYPCAGDWPDWRQYTYACYTDLRALWSVERLNEGAIPYRDHPSNTRS
jgi:hypothetical protein